ncbi:hypothetical protein TH61_12905 [Rufibacter sp. DG15C]|uniref:hypothetical protein n=1 Tax=Rufibacter sp. DG15C TaxID=1379909 RepID=UPI00078DEE56|nr:hypothetical protein [Rufibacter sp. DG15C]AMM51899.1 hypothetical protein TH61_12905 [Rufibacter sp. DG15C]
MRIITEAINTEPMHSVTKQDVLTVLKYVPKDWIGLKHTFLISAQKFDSSGWNRPVILNQTTFRILSRGLPKQQVIKELLLEIAINPTQTYPKKLHILEKEQRRKLEEVIQPFYEKILAEL